MQNGDTALIKSAMWGYVDTAKVLIQHGADVNHQDEVSLCEDDGLVCGG